MGFTIKLAGQDITSTVQLLPSPAGGDSIPNAQAIKIDQTLGQGAGAGGASSGRTTQATFLTTLGPAATAAGAGTTPKVPTLVRQGEVIITDSVTGIVVFGGFVGKLDDATNKTKTYTQVNCYDYWQSLARININQVFDGISDIAAIKELIVAYAPWVDLSQLQSFQSGWLLGQVWRNKTLQWALQKIADITGRQVWVNPKKQLMYVSPTASQPAAFTLSDTPDFFSSFPHAINTFTVDDTSIINRVTFYGGKQPTPDFIQDISTQANGNNKVFVLAYYPRKSTSGAVVITVNGASQVLGYALGTGVKNILKSLGGDCDVLLNADARTLLFDVAPPVSATVLCTYRYELPLIIEITNQASVSFFGNYYDGTISDETVVDSATAIQRCQVLLLEQAYGLTSMQLRTWTPGLQAGQQLTIVNSVRGINGVYIIQEVVAAPLSPTINEYTVTLGAWNWNLVDILQMIAQRTNGNDTAQTESVTPTQVSVLVSVGANVISRLSTQNRAMGAYFPGVPLPTGGGLPVMLPMTLPAMNTTTQVGSDNVAYAGLSSI